jgi:hypothetical protein
LAHELGASAGDQLVHADLHYGNILAGTREPWLAIDPKPVGRRPRARRPRAAVDPGGRTPGRPSDPTLADGPGRQW